MIFSMSADGDESDRKPHTFVEKINHLTGEREWTVPDEEYDIIQEVARSRFGDMILDYDRNDRYEDALKTIIAEKKGRGEYVHVLDIGTGTGLLSLMAARAGADKVTALEVFAPMAECAKNIIANSEFQDIVSVVATRSTDLSHLGEKPNVIVAEVFDTELIGEGALRTFKEALENLVQPGCRVIPARARFFIQPVQSSFLSKFNTVPELPCGSGKSSPLGGDCPGNCAVHDIQLSRLQPGVHFDALAEPAVAFEFDFENSESIIYDESALVRIEATSGGRLDAILSWWDLDMDGSGGGNTLTMAPEWRDKDSRWRDHWMQAVYYPPQKLVAEAGKSFTISAHHDEFSLWFGVGDESLKSRPYCTCNFHAKLSRAMIYRLNSVMEDDRLRAELTKQLRLIENGHVVALGEGSFMGLLVANISDEVRVTIVDPNPHMRMILFKYIRHYGLQNATVVATTEEVHDKPSLIVGEPSFLSSVLPWENLPFWFETEKLRTRFGSDVPVLPQSVLLVALPMRFEHLHTTASRVGTVSGFDLSIFDQLSEKARSAVDAIVEDHSLWEYDGQPTGVETELLSLDLNRSPYQEQKTVKVDCGSSANGIAVWAEWKFGEYALSTGWLHGKDSSLDWHAGHKQGVYFIPPEHLGAHNVAVASNFDLLSGDMQFQFIYKTVQV